MPLTHQPYTDRNFEFWEIHEMLTESYKLTGNINMWSFCRFENWRYRIHHTRQRTDAKYLCKLARLWRDDDERLQGVALSEDGLDDIHVIVHPGNNIALHEMYTWVNTDLAQRRPRVETFTDAEDKVRRQLLTDLGFICKGESEYLRHYDLTELPGENDSDDSPNSQSRYSGHTPGNGNEWIVQDVLFDRNLEERARVMGSAFRSNFVLDQEYLLKWDAARQAPGYRPHLELAAVQNEKVFGAVCFGWVDLRNMVGELEPVGTHPSYRRRGLASAVIKENFKRMRAMGLKRTFIASGAEPNPSNRLYESLHPVHKQVFEYWVKVYR
jgi:GNAT superfamily N-acetyltransferase